MVGTQTALIERGNVTSPHAGRTPAVQYVWALARVSLGWIFLWAFLDKLFGLGHETVSGKSWLNGGSPTSGFLAHATGPFAGAYHSMAGNALWDWLFMLGLLAIGTALIAGIGMRVATIGGVIMLVLMWSAALPPANNVFMDEHLIYATVLVGLFLTGAGKTLGLGRVWNRTLLVQRFPWLA